MNNNCKTFHGSKMNNTLNIMTYFYKLFSHNVTKLEKMECKIFDVKGMQFSYSV